MAKILIIDDDPDIVMAVRLCLRSAGHEVFDASNSERGLRLLDEIRPDLIILDVMMDTATEGSRTRPRRWRPTSISRSSCSPRCIRRPICASGRMKTTCR